MEVSRILREKLNRYIHLGGTDTTSDLLSIITINAGLRLILQGGLCLKPVNTRVIGCWAIGFGGRKSFAFHAGIYWS